MEIKVALAGNPNSGKTTLFNKLTGSNQYIGNWPGVTVEKKEGKIKDDKEITITDLPGIYSLSPYTLEEVVARDYLLDENPDAIINIVDGTNLERNLYLTTQLIELGIPVVVAINMYDVVEKNKDKININALSKQLDCEVIPISALKGKGIDKLMTAVKNVAKNGRKVPVSTFSGTVEHALAHIEEAVIHDMDPSKQRWYSIKIFERDEKVLKFLNINSEILNHIEKDIQKVEEELDDDSESIITNERYIYISELLRSVYVKKRTGSLSVSDKIDRIVTNRWLGLPIFILIMFLVYYISISTVGAFATNWANDGLFGEGYHLFGIGTKEYESKMDEFSEKFIFTEELTNTVKKADEANVIGADKILKSIQNKDFREFEEAYSTYSDELTEKGFDISKTVDTALEREDVPVTENFGIWVPGVPVLVEKGLDKINTADWLKSLIIDGIIAGVGGVLGFLPQMFVLFILLGLLEGSGYMARIAFILDRIFRKFGLSGKSFIPMLISTGCAVPGIMASRTIENEKDRRMTIITTSFMPCGAKLPIIALIASALFDGKWWVAPSAYFLGIISIIVSGIILKKTKMFSGDPAPFVMELPSYHLPTFKNVMTRVWERISSFIKRAGTVILISSIIIWLGSKLGIVNGSFAFDPNMDLEVSILGYIGKAISFVFIPLGFANIKAAVATMMGFVAKEEVVAVFGVLDFNGMTPLAAYSFLTFNLLCAPCFAAIGAIRREMNSKKWTLFAVAYQTVFAYAVSLMIYQFGQAFSKNLNIAGLVAAIITLGTIIYLLLRPQKKNKSPEKIKV
ncbi:MAG: ferrous iron transporter B [Clostridia bacterium]|nr:ferrous iron transporter B [Clostridia bacterium]